MSGRYLLVTPTLATMSSRTVTTPQRFGYARDGDHAERRRGRTTATATVQQPIATPPDRHDTPQPRSR